MIPPKQNAAFVAAMEDILDIYQRPYDAKKPVVNMDEHLVQLVKETRFGVATRPDSPQRFDYEYERNGTAVNFMFTEPLSGWRKVRVRQRKTALDWAHEIKELLSTDYRDAETVVLVCDNLNTHKPACLPAGRRHSTRPSHPKKRAGWPGVSKSTIRPSTGAGSTLPRSN